MVRLYAPNLKVRVAVLIAAGVLTLTPRRAAWSTFPSDAWEPSSPAPSEVLSFQSCPPHLEGDDCQAAAFPSCATHWSLRTRVAPCHWAKDVLPTRQFPVTCECLLECDAAGLAARRDCVWDRPMLPTRYLARRKRPGGTLTLLRSYLQLNLSGYAPPWTGTPADLTTQGVELFVDALLVT